MTERKIGEIFIDDRKRLMCCLVQNVAHCGMCYYSDKDGNCNCNRFVAGNCMAAFRTDKQNVVFIEW